MNVNDYGVEFAFFTSYDMSANTDISIIFTKPDGTEKTVTAPDVTVPPTPLVTSGPTFPGNEYALYLFKQGDVDQIGIWHARVFYVDSVIPQGLYSNIGSFIVNP